MFHFKQKESNCNIGFSCAKCKFRIARTLLKELNTDVFFQGKNFLSKLNEESLQKYINWQTLDFLSRKKMLRYIPVKLA